MRTLQHALSRLWRCHWLTWGAMLLTALALVLIVVPGEFIDPVRRPPLTAWQEQCKAFYESAYGQHIETTRRLGVRPTMIQVLEHGWPQPFLARALPFKATPSGQRGLLFNDVSWSKRDNWPLSADHWMFRLQQLLVDMLVALLIVGVVGGATEWRVRSRGTAFRFTMLDLLLALSVIGTGLGIYAYHARLQRFEARGAVFSLSPDAELQYDYMHLWRQYVGPIWLRKLVGNARCLGAFYHVTRVAIDYQGTWPDQFKLLPKLPYLKRVEVHYGLPITAVKQLELCRQLEELRLPPLDSSTARNVRPVDVANLRQFQHHLGSRADFSLTPLMGAQKLGLLQELRLSTIELAGADVMAEHVEQVASFANMRKIVLRSVSATSNEIDAIRARHPAIEIIEERSPFQLTPGILRTTFF